MDETPFINQTHVLWKPGSNAKTWNHSNLCEKDGIRIVNMIYGFIIFSHKAYKENELLPGRILNFYLDLLLASKQITL